MTEDQLRETDLLVDRIESDLDELWGALFNIDAVTDDPDNDGPLAVIETAAVRVPQEWRKIRACLVRANAKEA